jgi:hypothetical protein
VIAAEQKQGPQRFLQAGQEGEDDDNGKDDRIGEDGKAGEDV